MDTFCIALEDDMAAWLRATAKAEGRTVTATVRQALLVLMCSKQIPPSPPSPADCPARGVELTGSRGQGDFTPAVLVEEPPATCGVSATAAGGACAGTAADSFSPREAP